MKFGAPRKLSSKAFWVDSGAESSQGSITRSHRGRSKSSIGRLTGRGISTSSTTISSSGQKRQNDEGFVDGRGRIKRSKSGDSQTDVAKVDADVQVHVPYTGDVHSVEEAEADSLAGQESETYGNRVHCCLVISPAGRPLHAYRSVRELLEALRDAIAGHRSLLEDGKILYRTPRQGGENEQEGTHFMVAISLRIFSSGNAKRGVNGMCTTHFSSVSPSSERKTMRKQITLTLPFLGSQKTRHGLRLGRKAEARLQILDRSIEAMKVSVASSTRRRHIWSICYRLKVSSIRDLVHWVV